MFFRRGAPRRRALLMSAYNQIMAKKVDSVEHRVRMHMLGVITELGGAATASESARVSAGDRKWLSEKVRRMQMLAHEVLERLESMESRAEGH